MRSAAQLSRIALRHPEPPPCVKGGGEVGHVDPVVLRAERLLTLTCSLNQQAIPGTILD